jgi:hypothetical protein
MRGMRGKGVCEHACYLYLGAAELCSRRITFRLVTDSWSPDPIADLSKRPKSFVS